MEDSSQTRTTERNILIEMYQFALELSNSQIPNLYELGHYLTDNLISKICMVVAKESVDNFNSTSYEKKKFPQLYRDTLEKYYPDALKYEDISDLHTKRNWYQHKFWSIEHHFNRQYAIDYINKVKEIMISIGIINNDDTQPTNYLKTLNPDTITELIKAATRSTTPIPDSYDDFKSILRHILKNYIIKYYRNVINNIKEPKIDRRIKNLVNKLIELNDSQAKNFIDKNGSVRHNQIVSDCLEISYEELKEKLKRNEIDTTDTKRSLPVLAGDLALIFHNKYESSLRNDHNYVRDIRGELAVIIGYYDYIKEPYNPTRFKNALTILETHGLIQQSGPEFETSDSPTEWKILDPSRLNEFVKKNSINYILRNVI